MCLSWNRATLWLTVAVPTARCRVCWRSGFSLKCLISPSLISAKSQSCSSEPQPFCCCGKCERPDRSVLSAGCRRQSCAMKGGGFPLGVQLTGLMPRLLVGPCVLICISAAGLCQPQPTNQRHQRAFRLCTCFSSWCLLLIPGADIKWSLNFWLILNNLHRFFFFVSFLGFKMSASFCIV